jgi:DNA-binding MarR family transcriptional regulator
MTQSAVTQLVQGAERAGLVRRLPDPRDRRSQQLRLTRKGSGCLRQVFRALGEERERILAVVSDLAA